MKNIWGDVKNFFILAIRANLGMNGEVCEYDGSWPEGGGQAIAFNMILGLFLGLLLKHLGLLSDKVVCWGLGILFFYSFIVITVLFPVVKEYLGISFPTRGGDIKKKIG